MEMDQVLTSLTEAFILRAAEPFEGCKQRRTGFLDNGCQEAGSSPFLGLFPGCIWPQSSSCDY